MPGRPMSHRTICGRDARGDRERLLGVARGADLGAPELHLQAQALERVGVVLDDQDAVALAQARHAGSRRLVRGRRARPAAARGRTRCRWPGPSLKPSTSPPCSWAMRRARVRPTPRPPSVRASVWSCCANSSNACGRNVGSMPCAAVLDRDLHRLRGAPHGDRDRRSARSVNLAALAIRLRERLRQPAAVAADEAGARRERRRRGDGRRR